MVEDGIGNLFNKEESHEVFAFFHVTVGVLNTVHEFSYDNDKNKKNCHSFFRIKTSQ